ncbi:MAG: coenzyme F420-0:L-glutamate ligase [Candidatus Bathyarchaeia archaeon]
MASGTPIVVRIPKINYTKYGIKPPRNYAYVYWRKQYPFDAFVKQLADIVASLADLVTGSADAGTPLVIIKNLT